MGREGRFGRELLGGGGGESEPLDHGPIAWSPPGARVKGVGWSACILGPRFAEGTGLFPPILGREPEGRGGERDHKRTEAAISWREGCGSGGGSLIGSSFFFGTVD